MELNEYKDQNLLIVSPSETRKYLLNKYSDKLYNIKYMSLEEFRDHYFFSYDYKTISYLISKYNYNIDICKIILNNLYVIDIDKAYKSKRLNELKDIKIDLMNNNLLIFDKMFDSFLKNKKIIVYNYNFLEKYEEEMFKNATIMKKSIHNIDSIVCECDSLEDEILFVIEEIITLMNKGVSLDKIYLTNVSSDYIYKLKEMFNYFHIPINIDIRESVYGTVFVQEYLKTKKLPAFKNRITDKLIDVINDLVYVSDDDNYDLLLSDKLKDTYLKSTVYKDAVNIIDIDDVMISDDDYLFVLGFNNESIPKLYKDIDYISDNLKNEVSLYDTNTKNKMSKESFIRSISDISKDRLFLSYKNNSSFNTYLPSTLIDELSLEVKKYEKKNYYNSNIYNKILLSEELDNYYKYSSKTPRLIDLISHYNPTYNTYSNRFTGINKDKFLNYINNSLKLSYTQINTYNNCCFKYYINYILKINPYEETFSIFIGNLFHEVFSKMYEDSFNFDEVFDKYLEKRELSLEELFFVKELKLELEDSISKIKKMEEETTFKDIYTEKELEVKLNTQVSAVLTGKIDKIMYKNNINDTYFSLVDYKTGTINTSINNMKYGIDMQLPIYLYLVYKSDMFSNPIMCGIYLQKVLFSKWRYDSDKDLHELKNNEMRLTGYSTDNENVLCEFDRGYSDSSMIRGMKVNKDGSINKNTKVLSDDLLYDVLKYTGNVINDTAKMIEEANFSINPKVISNLSSCRYCKFKDVCFTSSRDNIYLDSVSNLDFLEDDNNEVD